MAEGITALAEYFRRSARNLGMGVDAAIDNAAANNARIKAGAASTSKLMSGRDLAPPEADDLHNSPIGGFGPENLGAGGAFMGTFAGRMAKVPNKRQLSSAQRAAAKGMDADEIRSRYGWFQAPDGDWKFEIPDNDARLAVDGRGGYTLQHPELYRAYPDLKKYTFSTHSRNDHSAEAFHDASNKVISLADDLPPHEALKALIHELQHGVQTIEGFNPGASPWHPAVKEIAHGSLMAKVNNAYSAMQRFNSTLNQWVNQQPRPSSIQDAWNMRQRFKQENPELAAEYEAAQDILANEPRYRRQEEFTTYQRSLGETEARDASFRINMTPEQRATVTPYYLGRIREVEQPFDPSQDIDLRAHIAKNPRKAADEPPSPLTTRQLISRHLGLSDDLAAIGGAAVMTPFLTRDAE